MHMDTRRKNAILSPSYRILRHPLTSETDPSTSATREEDSTGLSVSDRLLPANGKEEEGEVVEETFEMEVERERSKTTRLGWSRILTVTMICLLTACLFADQNLMAPNLTAISQEFSFTPQVHVLKVLYNL